MGSYALLLGFMGAEVIKVELRFTYGHQPRRGTAHLPGRGALSWGEPGERPWNRTAHYVHRNGNKRSLTWTWRRRVARHSSLC